VGVIVVIGERERKRERGGSNSNTRMVKKIPPPPQAGCKETTTGTDLNQNEQILYLFLEKRLNLKFEYGESIKYYFLKQAHLWAFQRRKKQRN
jgi:hypothetical protein